MTGEKVKFKRKRCVWWSPELISGQLSKEEQALSFNKSYTNKFSNVPLGCANINKHESIFCATRKYISCYTKVHFVPYKSIFRRCLYLLYPSAGWYYVNEFKLTDILLHVGKWKILVKIETIVPQYCIMTEVWGTKSCFTNENRIMLPIVLIFMM